MSNFEPWQGYLVNSTGDYHYICSPWKFAGACVFGFDSDYTTMAIALVRYLTSNGHQITLSDIDEKVSKSTLLAATEVTPDGSKHNLLCNTDASLTIASGKQPNPDLPIDVMRDLDADIYNDISTAWLEELNERNISQGAYISGQQYGESLEARLSLVAQDHGSLIWPQRQLDAAGNKIDQIYKKIEPAGVITSWTKLSAAGAPSEFALRAPILGGISTVMIQTTDGPNGVFLLVDDGSVEPIIGKSVELVVRRLYAQEGVMRYGLKALLAG